MQDETTHPEPAEDVPQRAIAYLRVSTSTQAEDGLGLDLQRDKLEEYAAEKTLDLIETVEEVSSGGIQNGKTFSWEHRPVLLELLERAKQGEYDTLLVARLAQAFPRSRHARRDRAAASRSWRRSRFRCRGAQR